MKQLGKVGEAPRTHWINYGNSFANFIVIHKSIITATKSHQNIESNIRVAHWHAYSTRAGWTYRYISMSRRAAQYISLS